MAASSDLFAAVQRARHGARRAFSRTGFDLVRGSYYSPIPKLEELDPALWDTPGELRGIGWDLDKQVAFARDELGPHIAEWKSPPGYQWPNDSFPHADARALDAIIRWTKPKRLLELGSGRSSLIIASALDADAEYQLVDPYPNATFLPQLVRQPELHSVSTWDVPAEMVTRLEPGDVLFADTTHAVKLGGDVTRLILDLLPQVKPGVIVHVHDIFWPFPYPKIFYEAGMYWQEQDLLQAMLQDNPTWEILLANHGAWRLRGDEMRQVMPDVTDGAQAGGSFWMRRLPA